MPLDPATIQQIKDTVIPTLIGGGVGASTLGLGSYLADSSGDEAQRREKAKERALIGGGLGMAGGLGYNALRRLFERASQEPPMPPGAASAVFARNALKDHSSLLGSGGGAILGGAWAGRKLSTVSDKFTAALAGKEGPKAIVDYFRTLSQRQQREPTHQMEFVRRLRSAAEQATRLNPNKTEFIATPPNTQYGIPEIRSRTNNEDLVKAVKKVLAPELKSQGNGGGGGRHAAAPFAKELLQAVEHKPTGSGPALTQALGGESVAGYGALPWYSRLWNWTPERGIPGLRNVDSVQAKMDQLAAWLKKKDIKLPGQREKLKVYTPSDMLYKGIPLMSAPSRVLRGAGKGAVTGLLGNYMARNYLNRMIEQQVEEAKALAQKAGQ